jgi:hypothetical protein
MNSFEQVKEELATLLKQMKEKELRTNLHQYELTDEFEDLKTGDTPWRWEYQHESCTSRCTRFKKRLYDRD